MKKKRILIVEDELLIALNLRDILVHLGYDTVSKIPTGEEAINVVKHHHIDLILMDVRLKGQMDGIETAQEINKIKDIPVIYLTAFSNPEIIERAKITEPYGFILKPFEQKDIEYAIHMALYKHEVELKIKENENYYSKIFSSIVEGVIATDEKGKVKFINNILEKLIGKTKEEVLGKSLNTAVKIKEFKTDIHLKKKLTEVLDSGEKISFNENITLVTADKKNLPIEANLTSLKDENGNITGAVLVIRDIAEKIIAEKRLKESEERYRNLFNNAPIGIYKTTFEGSIIMANPQLIQMLGYSTLEDLQRRNLRKEGYLDPNERKEFIHQIKKEGIVKNFESYWTKKNGEIICVRERARIIKDEKEKKLLLEGTVEDITEYKKYEEDLRKLSQAVEQSPSSIIITDKNGNIEYVNPRFTEITGYSANEAKGKQPHILKTEIGQVIWNDISKGKEWRGEFENKKKNGELYWEYISISPIFDEQNKITHYLAILADITERKINEKQLIKAKELAEKSDKLKSEFLAQISHEVRTPLNNILTFNSMLKDDFVNNLTPELENDFKVIETSSKRLIRTIELVLTLAKIQTGNIEINFTEIDLDKDLLEDLNFEFHSRAKAKNLNFSYLNEAGYSKVLADRSTLEQIFANLLDNAIKYTDEGKILLRLYNDFEGNVCVDVADSGIGMTGGFIPNMFNPFTQDEIEGGRKSEGTGLGLALVKKYIEISDAEIKVISNRGIGTTFTVIFKPYKFY